MNGDDEKRLWKDVGYIKAKVDTTLDEIGTVRGSIGVIHGKIDKLSEETVKKSDCARAEHAEQISELTHAVANISHKVGTKEYPSVAAPKSFGQRVKDNLGTLALIVGLLGGVLAGWLKLAYMTVAIDQVAKRQQVVVQQQKTALKKLAPPKIIYVKVPTDAGRLRP